MLEYKDIITYSFSALTIIITAIFSYLVWKATKENAEVAKASYKLSESIVNSQKQIKQSIKEEYIRKVLNNAKEVREILQAQKIKLNADKMKNAPKSCGLSDEQLAEYIDSTERLRISKAWEYLAEYLNNCWQDHNGVMKVGFAGDEAQMARNGLEKPMYVFDELIKVMEGE